MMNFFSSTRVAERHQHTHSPYHWRQFHMHPPRTNLCKIFHLFPHKISCKTCSIPNPGSLHNSHHSRSIIQVLLWSLMPQSHNYTHLMLMRLAFQHIHHPVLSQTSLYHTHPVVHHPTPTVPPYPNQSLDHSHQTLISTPSTCTLGG